MADQATTERRKALLLILEALDPLDPDSRARALDSATRIAVTEIDDPKWAGVRDLLRDAVGERAG